MEYARMDGETIIERREMDEPPPPHKAHLWLPVIHQGDGPLTQTAIEAGSVVITHSAIPLDQIKTALKAQIDDEAEKRRGIYLTLGSGMAMTYQEKFAQATAANKLGETACNAMTAESRAATFPLLDASVGIEAASLWDVSQLVLQRYAAFAAVARAIEQTRLSVKKAISDASDEAAARAAREALTWTV